MKQEDSFLMRKPHLKSFEALLATEPDFRPCKAVA